MNQPPNIYAPPQQQGWGQEQGMVPASIMHPMFTVKRPF